MVRHELARGTGVPLDYLSTGPAVSGVSFFWPKEFIAICRARHYIWYRKVLFVVFLLHCTIFKCLVAPACATALLPINRYWEAGGTGVWLNSTFQQIFPDTLNDTHTLGTISAVSASQVACPSARWQVIGEEYLQQLA